MGGRTKKICPPLHCITKMAGKKWREKGGGGGGQKNMSNLAWCYKDDR